MNPSPKCMSLTARVAVHLPYLRRYARAVTGSQTSGDAYVAAVLEALIADISTGMTIEPGDTAETLAARVLPEEHALYPIAVERAALEILQRQKV